MHIYEHDSMARKQEAGEKHTHTEFGVTFFSRYRFTTYLVRSNICFFLKSIKFCMELL